MKIFAIDPVLIPDVTNPTRNIKVVGLSGRIVFGEVGDSETMHTYYVQFWQEIETEGETNTVPFTDTNLTVTQAQTVAIMNPETQHAAIAALAANYGYTLLPENDN